MTRGTRMLLVMLFLALLTGMMMQCAKKSLQRKKAVSGGEVQSWLAPAPSGIALAAAAS